MTVNGFNKNGNVYWEFINSKDSIDWYGYFETNDTGGFDDYTFLQMVFYQIYIQFVYMMIKTMIMLKILMVKRLI